MGQDKPPARGWGIWEFVVFVLIVIVIVLVVVQWIYNRNLFAPSEQMISIDKYKYQNLYIGTKTETVRKVKTKDEDHINMWHFNNYPENKVVLFFHGNSGNISNREYVIDICDAFRLNLLLVDYRGYGNSDSSPKIGYLPEDGIIAYRYLSKIYTSNDIVVWGESLGGSVATYIARQFPCRCLILLSTFSSLSDVVDHYPGIESISRSFIRGFINVTGNELNTKEWIKGVRCPVLQIHSIEDDLISYKSAKSLFKNITTHKKMIQIKGTHSSPRITDKQLKEVFDFIGVRNQRNLGNLVRNLEQVAKKYDWV